ncbi:MAG: alpha amylase C-terminal domain-containing protein [Lachnospiraceae bacterium]|nr:alpha amylase C-terminal domain-containing protein [Lachnospiraceae bacterium]MDY5497599.1 alpha amylase C-terminal domain-containing protein [Anaerobutyricum sp.]
MPFLSGRRRWKKICDQKPVFLIIVLLFFLCTVGIGMAVSGEESYMPVLSWNPGKWEESEQFSDCLFSGEDCGAGIKIRDDNFGKGLQESMIFQVTEKKGTGRPVIHSYGFNDFEEKGAGIYEKSLDYNVMMGEEGEFSIRLFYQNGEGNLLKGKDGEYEKYGTVEQGMFRSKRMIIDKKAPQMDNKMMLQGEKDTDLYYKGEIKAEVCITESYLDHNAVCIMALPLNERARASANQEQGVKIEDWICKKSGDENRISFSFHKDGKWKFVMTCADVAKNRGVIPETNQEQVESKAFFIDTEKPQINVSSPDIIKIADQLSSVSAVNDNINYNLPEIRDSSSEVFVKEGGKIHIEIVEENFLEEQTSVFLSQVIYDEKTGDFIEKNRIRQDTVWEKEKKNTYIWDTGGLEEGHYRVVICCKDSAGNLSVREKDSEIYTVDATIPEIIEISPEGKPESQKEGVLYCAKSPVLVVKIAEENFNHSNFQMAGKMCYSDGSEEKEAEREHFRVEPWHSYYEDGVRVNETRIHFLKQGKHFVSIYTLDAAGNQTTKIEKEIVFDSEKPEIIYTGKDKKNEDIVFRAPEAGNGINNIIYFRKYMNYRYFSSGKIQVDIRIFDKVSGVDKIRYSFVPEGNGNVVWKEAKNLNHDRNSSWYRIQICPEQKEFKGFLQVSATDACGNTGKLVKTKGMVSESSVMHESTKGISVVLPDAAYTDEKGRIKYYDGNVSLKAILSDGWSGIEQAQLCAMGKNRPESRTKERWDYRNEPDITAKKLVKLNLPSEKYRFSEKNNPVKIKVWFRDNVGNESKINYSDYRVVIDDVKPEIKVTYDKNNKNSTWYSEGRTAFVTVKDKNFNPDSVKWNIRGSNKKYHISSWKKEGDEYCCKVCFQKDGERYRIGLTLADYANNRAEWRDSVSFSIDRAMPEVRIVMDGSEKNGRRYFNQKKIIKFYIKEKNIKQNGIKYKLQGRNGKKKLKIQAPVMVKMRDGSYCAILELRRDGFYKIGICCEDKAGNKSAMKELPGFVIDTTAPRVMIRGVKDRETYGGAVKPEVEYLDQNMNPETVKISLLKMNGKRITGKECPYKKNIEKNIIRILWEDFPHNGKMDGIYRLKVSGSDLAGNRIKKEILFYVDRQGPDFSLDEVLQKTLSCPYLREETAIQIREFCVNPTRTNVIIFKDNEQRLPLTEKQETGEGGYQTSSRKISDKREERYGWYEKTYRIGKENFEPEGTYRVLIRSDDLGYRGKQSDPVKTTDNEMKAVPVQFTIDKTPPSVRIGNLGKDIYEKKSHDFTVTVLDNYAFEEMELRVIRERTQKEEVFKIRKEDLDENHTVTRTLKKYNGYQTIKYRAWDKAGNEVTSDENNDTRKCLVTNNKIVHTYYKNRYLYGMAVTAFAILITGIVYGLLRLRKKIRKIRF